MIEYKSIMVKNHINSMEILLRDFENEVNSALSEGWELQGGPSIFKDIYTVYAIQIITKRKEQ